MIWLDLQESLVIVASDGLTWLIAGVIAAGIILAVMRGVTQFMRTVMRWD